MLFEVTLTGRNTYELVAESNTNTSPSSGSVILTFTNSPNDKGLRFPTVTDETRLRFPTVTDETTDLLCLT